MILRSAAALLLLALGCAHRAAAPGATVQAEGDSGGAREPQRYISARAYHHYLDALLAKNADDLVTAAEELREALLYDPESAYLHAVLADVLIKQARIADADAELASALSLDPHHGPAHLLARRMAVSRNQPAQRPESPEVLAALARVARAEGDVEAVSAHARKLLALAANLEPSDGVSGEREDDRRDVCLALLRVAVPLLGAHRSAEAQHALEGALRLYPDHPELSFYRALALVQRGRPRQGALAFEAVERSLRARGEEPPSPAFLGIEPDALVLDAQVQGALARGRAGEAPESMRRLRVFFAEHPAEEGVALALLEAFDRAGKAAEAEQILAASVRAHPETGAVLYALGNAQDRAGMRQKALSTMRKVLAVQPQHAGALNYIGYTFTERGKPADLREAEDLLARAVELRPDDGAIADSYGFCLLKLGRASEALAELRRADRLTPRDPVILSHLGDALLAAGKKEEALSAFRRALALLLPGSRRRPSAAEAQAMIDPPDRSDRDGPRVRAEIVKKLKVLAP